MHSGRKFWSRLNPFRAGRERKAKEAAQREAERPESVDARRVLGRESARREYTEAIASLGSEIADLRNPRHLEIIQQRIGNLRFEIGRARAERRDMARLQVDLRRWEDRAEHPERIETEIRIMEQKIAQMQGIIEGL